MDVSVGVHGANHVNGWLQRPGSSVIEMLPWCGQKQQTSAPDLPVYAAGKGGGGGDGARPSSQPAILHPLWQGEWAPHRIR